MANAKVLGAAFSHMKKRIGFFGGTFSPPHFGHINLAVALKEHTKCSEVIVCPTGSSPFKEKNESEKEKLYRYEMCQRAFKEIPGFTLSKKEIHSSGVQYTIDTVKTLKKEDPDTEFMLFLGADHIPLLPNWKEIDELFEIANPFFGMRPGATIQLPEGLSETSKKFIRQGLVDVPQFEISATDVRERLGKRLYCGHLVPAKVLDFIYEHSIYFLV